MMVELIFNELELKAPLFVDSRHEEFILDLKKMDLFKNNDDRVFC